MTSWRKTTPWLALLLPLVLLVAAPALAKRGGVPAHQDAYDDNGPGPGRGHGGPPEAMPPGQVKRHGAPPWAPGPGAHAKRVYRYYPAQSVYFDPGRKLWFWLDGGGWRMGAALPVGITVAGGYVSLTMGVDMPYQFHPQVVEVYPPHHRVKGGPPPWAPAHGRRAKHMYRYYPGSQVYFDPGRGVWFWLSGNNWSFGAALPAGIRVGGSYVTLGMDESRPYQYHREVIRYYPAR